MLGTLTETCANVEPVSKHANAPYKGNDSIVMLNEWDKHSSVVGCLLQVRCTMLSARGVTRQ